MGARGCVHRCAEVGIGRIGDRLAYEFELKASLVYERWSGLEWGGDYYEGEIL